MPIGLPFDWFIDRPLDFAFGITAEPQRTDPFYPRNPSGYVYRDRSPPCEADAQMGFEIRGG